LRYLDRLQPLALLILRIVIGVIMVAHGYHKVFGGLGQFSHMVGNMGLPAWLGYVAAFTELLGVCSSWQDFSPDRRPSPSVLTW